MLNFGASKPRVKGGPGSAPAREVSAQGGVCPVGCLSRGCLPGAVCLRGVCLGACLPMGGCTPPAHCMLGHTHTVNRMTDRQVLKNHPAPNFVCGR